MAVDLTGYQLTFDDEFNSASISQGSGTVWSDIRPGSRMSPVADIGFGDSAFVDSASGINPFSLQNGALEITAVPAGSNIVGPGRWASGLISTQYSFAQEYGYFEMRAMLPTDVGVWPAFWMLPADQASPSELDVFEAYGGSDLYQTVRTNDGTDSYQVTWSNQPTMTSGYHTFGVMWDPQHITFYFDGNVTGQQATPADMHTPMYMLANLAMQDLRGVTDNPKHFYIDYVRAYSPYFVTNDAAEVARLYYGLLDRAPDPGGLQGFTSALENGASPQLVAQTMMGSAEYENTLVGQSNASFVQYLYSTALGRSPDAPGFQGWENALNTGTLSRADVVNGFLSSPEFQSDYAGQSNATYINAVYEVALQHPADPVGLAGWEGALANGMSRTTFDQLVVGSPEFQSSIAEPAAGTFVGTLYEQALGRAPDAQGLQGWTSALVTGNLNNVGVAIGIAESPEAQQFLSPRIETG